MSSRSGFIRIGVKDKKYFDALTEVLKEIFGRNVTAAEGVSNLISNYKKHGYFRDQVKKELEKEGS